MPTHVETSTPIASAKSPPLQPYVGACGKTICPFQGKTSPQYLPLVWIVFCQSRGIKCPVG